MPPPKPTPPAKLALILAYFHRTRVAHSIKDLEKALPAAAGISSMQVKDALGELVTESQVRVEKIGSGNWYWSFPADAAVAKRTELAKVRAERDKTAAAVATVRASVDAEMQRVREEDAGKAELVERLESREETRRKLQAELEQWDGAGAVELKERETLKLRERANRFVDNLWALQSHAKNSGSDREAIRNINEMLGIEEDMDYIE